MSDSKNDYKPLARRSSGYRSRLPQDQYKARGSRKLFISTLVGIFFLIGVSTGFLISDTARTSESKSITDSQLVNVDRNEDRTTDEVDFGLFWDVWDLARAKHVDQPVNEVDMMYAAISGLISGIGDPYSIYFDPEQSAEFIGEINGSFEGIGAEIGIKREKLTIIAPLSGSPAERDGLLPGDVVLSIDGLDAGFMSLNQAVSFIRGEKGTVVILTVRRKGVDEPLNIEITRGKIQIESVKLETINKKNKKISIITLSHFNGDTTAKFKEAVNDILLEQPDAIILDLRNNAGGFLDSSIDIASQFIEEGQPVVFEESSEGEASPFLASGSAPLSGTEIVVLMNEGSASAAEILAGALQDYELATLIGTTSFGKGTVQDLQTFSDGSSLKLTVARWLTPLKNQINEIGIDPDYKVERTAEDYSEDRDPPLKAATLLISDPDAFHKKYKKYDPSTDPDKNNQDEAVDEGIESTPETE